MQGENGLFKGEMMSVNAYDFDDTIYAGDSTRDFFKFCLGRYKKMWWLLPMQIFYSILFLTRLMEKTSYKEKIYRFLRCIPDIDLAIEEFWKAHSSNIKLFYLEQKRADDFIISASPEFLLEPMIKQLGLNYLIASRVDKHTGCYTGLNCYGEEKVNRLKEAFPNVEIVEFYSDSHSDAPLARIAKKAFLVKGSNIIDWVV